MGVAQILGGERALSWRLHPGVFAGVRPFWRLLHVSQLMLGPGALLLLQLLQMLLLLLLLQQVLLKLLLLRLLSIRVERSHIISVCTGLRVEHSAGSLSGGFVRVAHHEAAGDAAHSCMLGGHPGAGADQLVAADGAGVGYLTLADGGGARAGAGLAQLVDLVHDAAKVSGPVLVQAGGHGQRDGRGRYSYIWWSVCVRELPWSVLSRRGLLEAVRHRLGADQLLQTLKLSSIGGVAQVLSHSLLCQ